MSLREARFLEAFPVCPVTGLQIPRLIDANCGFLSVQGFDLVQVCNLKRGLWLLERCVQRGIISDDVQRRVAAEMNAVGLLPDGEAVMDAISKATSLIELEDLVELGDFVSCEETTCGPVETRHCHIVIDGEKSKDSFLSISSVLAEIDYAILEKGLTPAQGLILAKRAIKTGLPFDDERYLGRIELFAPATKQVEELTLPDGKVAKCTILATGNLGANLGVMLGLREELNSRAA